MQHVCEACATSYRLDGLEIDRRMSPSLVDTVSHEFPRRPVLNGANFTRLIQQYESPTCSPAPLRMLPALPGPLQ